MVYIHSTNTAPYSFIKLTNSFTIDASSMLGWAIYETCDPIKKCTFMVGCAIKGDVIKKSRMLLCLVA